MNIQQTGYETGYDQPAEAKNAETAFGGVEHTLNNNLEYSTGISERLNAVATRIGGSFDLIATEAPEKGEGQLGTLQYLALGQHGILLEIEIVLARLESL